MYLKKQITATKVYSKILKAQESSNTRDLLVSIFLLQISQHRRQWEAPREKPGVEVCDRSFRYKNVDTCRMEAK